MTKTYAPPTEMELELIVNKATSLGVISPDDSHLEWLKALTMIKRSGCASARDVALRWSQESDKFDPNSFRSTWNRIKDQGSKTIASLIYEIKQRDPNFRVSQRELTPAEKREWAIARAAAEKEAAAKEAKEARSRQYLLDSILKRLSSDLTNVIKYYVNRKIYGNIRPGNIYWSDNLKTLIPGKIREYQTLSGQVALFTDVNGNVKGLHQTFIDPVTGQKVRNVRGESKIIRKGSSDLVGSAIRMNESPTGVYILSEGIENGLAAMKVYDSPMLGVYAAGSAANLPSVEFPPHARLVFIFADTGKDGEQYALNAQENFRNKGLTAFVVFPEMRDLDWNDLLMEFDDGHQRFPALNSFLG